jgi:WD40 repeat protein
LNVWETNSGEQLASLGAYNSPINDLDFSPNGRLLATAILTGGPGTVEIWDVAAEEVLTRLQGERLDFAPDGTSLASIVFGSIRLWGVAP